MTHLCCGDREQGRRDTAKRTAGDWLALAASPTFAAMALLSGVGGGDAAAMICASAPGSPLTGMATMYLLMSVFHAAPWLKLASRSA